MPPRQLGLSHYIYVFPSFFRAIWFILPEHRSAPKNLNLNLNIMPTINGFDLQIQIRRKTAEFHGVVIDKMARTAECYLQAVPGDVRLPPLTHMSMDVLNKSPHPLHYLLTMDLPRQPFAVSWQCKKTAPPTRGDVWVDGAWVGARRIDCSVGAGAGAGADEARFARVLIHREQRDREGEAERRKLVFRKSAMREAERGDDGGVRAMGDVFGVGGGSGSGSGAGDAGGDGTDVGAQMVVLGADMVSCGLGEVRLVINRVGEYFGLGWLCDPCFRMC